MRFIKSVIQDDLVHELAPENIEFGENGDAVRSEAVVKKANNETGSWEFVATQGVAE